MDKNQVLKTFTASVDTVKGSKAEGYVKAVFSTFDVVDRDGDMIKAGAIPDGVPVKLSSWGHKHHELAVGKGMIKTTSKNAIFEGSFNLNTVAGREAYETVKFMGEDQEWSWAFSIPEGGWEYSEKNGERVRVITKTVPYEVSPVLIGSNPKTNTVAIKGWTPDKVVIDDTEMPEVDDEESLTKEEETQSEEKAVEVTDDTDLDESDDLETKAVDTGVIEEMIAEIASIAADTLAEDGVRSWDVELLINVMRLLEYYLGDLVYDEVYGEAAAETATAEIKQRVRETLRVSLVKHRDILAFAGLALVDEHNEEQSTNTYTGQAERLLADFDAFFARTKSLVDLRAKQGRQLAKSHEERIANLKAKLQEAADGVDAFAKAGVEETPNTGAEGEGVTKSNRQRQLELELELRQRRLRLED